VRLVLLSPVVPRSGRPLLRRVCRLSSARPRPSNATRTFALGRPSASTSSIIRTCAGLDNSRVALPASRPQTCRVLSDEQRENPPHRKTRKAGSVVLRPRRATSPSLGCPCVTGSTTAATGASTEPCTWPLHTQAHGPHDPRLHRVAHNPRRHPQRAPQPRHRTTKRPIRPGCLILLPVVDRAPATNADIDLRIRIEKWQLSQLSHARWPPVDTRQLLCL
jgi:hypothetical protein